MNRGSRSAIALACVLWAAQGNPVQAQWGYPEGFGGFGWGGWGLGGETVEGATARGMGVFAAGAGLYNKKTAIADQINTDTVMRWNQYVHESQREANRQQELRQARRRERVIQTAEATRNRLRDNPEPRDIFQGDALNVALDEIDDPRVYTKVLQGAKVKIGSDAIRAIPFRYAAGAITISLHQLATGTLPASLLTPDFQAQRDALRELDRQISEQVADGDPDPETVKKLLGVIYGVEEKVASIYADPAKRREHNEADKYLKALHGLVVMLKAPSIELALAGVEKRRDATLGELLTFMNAFNLRFGVATTPQHREVYQSLYPKLRTLRDQVAPALAATATPKVSMSAAEDFFSGMSYDDLRKKAPRP